MAILNFIYDNNVIKKKELTIILKKYLLSLTITPFVDYYSENDFVICFPNNSRIFHIYASFNENDFCQFTADYSVQSDASSPFQMIYTDNLLMSKAIELLDTLTKPYLDCFNQFIKSPSKGLLANCDSKFLEHYIFRFPDEITKHRVLIENFKERNELNPTELVFINNLIEKPISTNQGFNILF